jgi:hypothetical protein
MKNKFRRLPSPVDSVITPRPRDQKIVMPTGIVNLSPPKDFQKKVQKLQDTGKIDREDFNNAKDIGNFLDFYNDTLKKKKDERAAEDILEISKLLVRLETQKSVIISPPKKTIDLQI